MASANIAFGLVSIPVKLFSASQSSEAISFNLLHKECGSRLRQQYICVRDEERVERSEMIKGYEFARGQYVTLSDEELKSIEERSTQEIAITEFVPTESVDPIYFDKAYYLGPERGGERGYRLLGEAMRKTGRWAVARYVARGKQYLVVLRPVELGLVMQQLHYADEVRPISEVEIGDMEVKENELKLAILLADQVTVPAFDPSIYTNEGQTRLKELIQQKVNGQEISLSSPEEPRGQVIDLMEALRASLGQLPKRGTASSKTPDIGMSGPKAASGRKPPKRATSSAPKEQKQEEKSRPSRAAKTGRASR
ncbi:MAG TPA: Ku protein [Thermoanaerobaculia bacterium]|nr:Ku protein [Thermoanaerobaculia bacterium]